MLTDRGRPEPDMRVAADPGVRRHDEVVLRSAAAATAGGADAVAGLLEDALDDAAECEDDDDDQRGDAGDEEAVLDRGRAALVHLGQAGVEHDAQVVEHDVWLLDEAGDRRVAANLSSADGLVRGMRQYGPAGLVAPSSGGTKRSVDRLRAPPEGLWQGVPTGI